MTIILIFKTSFGYLFHKLQIGKKEKQNSGKLENLTSMQALSIITHSFNLGFSLQEQ